jgi:hypothetical protein
LATIGLAAAGKSNVHVAKVVLDFRPMSAGIDPTIPLDIHARAGVASQFGLGDYIDFEGWQYEVIGYEPQPDGTAKVRLQPTGHPAQRAVPTYRTI